MTEEQITKLVNEGFKKLERNIVDEMKIMLFELWRLEKRVAKLEKKLDQ